MKRLRNELAITTSEIGRAAVTRNTRASAPEMSLPSIIVVAYLVIGVPALFAAYILTSSGRANLIIYPLFALFVSTASFNFKALGSSRAHRFFYSYFLVLLLATILSLARADAAALYTPFKYYTRFSSLVVCFIWLSVFVSAYFIVKTPRQYAFAMRLLNVVGIAIAFSVFLSYVGPEYLGFSFGEIGYGEGIRALGPFGDQVGFALGYFALRSLVKKRWLGVVLYLPAILLTGTRGAVVSVAIGALWLFIEAMIKSEPIRRFRTGIVMVSIWATAVALIFLSTPYGAGMVGRFEALRTDSASAFQRRTAINLGIRVYLDNPLMGVGYLGFNRLSNEYDFYQYFRTSSDTQRGTFTAQNQYVQTATDAGTPGLLILLLFLWSLLRELREGYNVVNDLQYRLDFLCCSAWVIAMVLGNQAAVWLLPGTITGYIFFLVTGLSLGMLRMQKQAHGSSASMQLTGDIVRRLYAR